MNLQRREKLQFLEVRVMFLKKKSVKSQVYDVLSDVLYFTR